MPRLRHEFEDSYKRFDDCDNVTAHEYWDLHNRQTRMTISSMPVDSHLFLKVRPFFDREYLQFAMSIPVSQRFGQNVYKCMIYRIGPEIRDVPNANTGRTLKPGSFANTFDHLLSNRRKVLRSVAGRLGFSYRDKTKIPAESIAESLRRDEGVRKIINDFVGSTYCDGDIFNRDGVLELLNEHYRGKADYSVPLTWMATMAVALPDFVYDRRSTRPDDVFLASPFNDGHERKRGSDTQASN
jgi:hypothetical protein